MAPLKGFELLAQGSLSKTVGTEGAFWPMV
jgi:hypothetical protein